MNGFSFLIRDCEAIGELEREETRLFEKITAMYNRLTVDQIVYLRNDATII